MRYLDNTIIDSTGVANLGFITTEIDGSTTNEIQQLAINTTTNTINLSRGGGSVPLGNLNNWHKNQNNQLSYNTANVGIGVEEPCSNLQIHSSSINHARNERFNGLNAVSGHVTGREDFATSKSSLLLTNKNSGKTCKDGLLIESNNSGAKIQLQENGNFRIFNNRNKGILIDAEGRIQINKYLTTNSTTRLLTINRYGFVDAQDVNSIGDNMGNCTATSNLDMNSNNILGGTTTENKTKVFSIYQHNDPQESAYIDMVGINHTSVEERGSMFFVTNGTTGDFKFKNYVNNDWKTRMTLKADGTLNLKNLEGTGNRVLVADDLGNVSAHTEITLNDNGTLNINNLQGDGERIVTTDSEGNILANTELSSLHDNMGNCNATRNIEMNSKNIYNNNNSDELVIGNSSGSKISMFGDNFNENYKKGSITFETKGETPQTGGFRFTNSSTWESLLFISSDGRVGIGTSEPDWNAKLTVQGTILEGELKLDVNLRFPDFVFENDYKLMGIYELEKYIQLNKHLPEIPTAFDVEKDNLNIGEMNVKLLQKVEELTLYIISLQKQIDNLNNKIVQNEK